MAMSDATPGLDALMAAVSALVPGATPVQAKVGLGLALGSSLEGVAAYPARGHWLYVGYGLSELGGKESDEPAYSGAGFEFSLRLRRDGTDTVPPQWPVRLFADLAQRVWDGAAYDLGDWIVTSGPIGGDQSMAGQTGLAILPDAQLPRLDTPNGAVHLFQLVPLTAAEAAAAQQDGSVGSVIADLAARDPLLRATPGRPSVR
jgi:Suppressor of fused protein (SUFU)